jgi:AMMECR1 domain-containing protein
MAWEVGKHGIRISFSYHGRKLGATYLPDVAKEQGWTKEEALISLMRKAGWSGRKDEWRKVAAGMELVTYEGKAVSLGYAEFKERTEKTSA